MNKSYLLYLLLMIVWPLSLTGQIVHEGASEGFSHHHHISLFGGYSTNYKGETGPKIGVEYEYRISKRIGIGGTLDFKGNDFRLGSFSVGGTVYPFKFPLLFAVGAGAKVTQKKWGAFLRLLGSYDFPVGEHFTLGPIVMYDLYSTATKDIMSYGLSLGYGF